MSGQFAAELERQQVVVEVGQGGHVWRSFERFAAPRVRPVWYSGRVEPMITCEGTSEKVE